MFPTYLVIERVTTKFSPTKNIPNSNSHRLKINRGQNRRPFRFTNQAFLQLFYQAFAFLLKSSRSFLCNLFSTRGWIRTMRSKSFAHAFLVQTEDTDRFRPFSALQCSCFHSAHKPLYTSGETNVGNGFNLILTEFKSVELKSP